MLSLCSNCVSKRTALYCIQCEGAVCTGCSSMFGYKRLCNLCIDAFFESCKESLPTPSLAVGEESNGVGSSAPSTESGHNTGTATPKSAASC